VFAEESEEEQRVAEIAGHILLPMSLALMLVLVLAVSLERCKLSWLPESAIVIAVGMALGGVLKTIFGAAAIVENKLLHELNAPIVNLLFLPIIIFESGWSLRWRDFAAQLQYILVFAVIGSLISMAVVGWLITISTNHHGIRSPRIAFAYGSLIAATDPVATLATYSQLNVEPLLNIMVLGEATINDAVAIVVFEILNSDSIFGQDGSTGNIGRAIGFGVIQKLFGSILLALILGCVYTLVLRFAQMQHAQLMEILYIVTSCYLTFSVAEEVGCSGIITTLFCSMMMGVYTKPHLSKEGLLLATFLVKGLATLADTGIFLLVGVDFIAANGPSFHFSLWVMLFCLVGRAAAVFPCGLAVNLWKSVHGRSQELPSEQWFLLSWRHLFMMWHAGLRGGIALVLCLELGDWVDAADGEGTKQTLINTTIVVIVSFLLIFGGSTQCFLKLLGIAMGEDFPEDYLYKSSLLTCTRRCLSILDARCCWPLLVGAPCLWAEEPPSEDSPDAREESISEVLRHAQTSHRGAAFFRRRSNPIDGTPMEDSSISESEVDTDGGV